MPAHPRDYQSPKKNTKLLQIIQVNVGKGGLAHDLALALAFEEDIDILLI